MGMKGGKAAMSKLEMKIRELEVELGGVQSRTQENYKAFQRAERRIKELQFQQDEDKKNQDRMSDLAQKLQAKIKTYKQQIEEAEEIAHLTWLNTEKLNKNLRKPKRDLKWLKLKSPPSNLFKEWSHHFPFSLISIQIQKI